MTHGQKCITIGTTKQFTLWLYKFCRMYFKINYGKVNALQNMRDGEQKKRDESTECHDSKGF
jgi:hypothetical protein